MADIIRVLLVADTHLGYDFPFRPRIERRRRGPDFFSNFERALEPALRGEVDLVVHGGDLLYRSRVPAALVELAMAPLIRVAKKDVPVYLVPGNHERSKIPLHLWGTHPNIHIFHEPTTFICSLPQGKIGISGFPFQRKVRNVFQNLVEQAKYKEIEVAMRLLCIHEAVEGAQVGPSNYTFRRGPDVVPGRAIPGEFTAILSGHIHRSQMLTHDLSAKRLGAPVIYPGSIERTSFAERFEEKHYVILEFAIGDNNGPKLQNVDFRRLPARPMESIEVQPGKYTPQGLRDFLGEVLAELDPNAVVRINVRGAPKPNLQKILTSPALRKIAPSSMNISLRVYQTDKKN